MQPGRLASRRGRQPGRWCGRAPPRGTPPRRRRGPQPRRCPGPRRRISTPRAGAAVWAAGAGAGLLRLPDRHSRPRSLLGPPDGPAGPDGAVQPFLPGAGVGGLRRGAGLRRGGPGHGDGRRSSLGLRGRFERFQIKGQLKILFMHGLLLLNEHLDALPPRRPAACTFPAGIARPCGIFGQKSGCFRQDTSVYYTPFVRKRKEGDENFLPSLTGPRRRARKACAISGVCPARPAAGRKKPPAAPRLPRPAGPAPRRGGG